MENQEFRELRIRHRGPTGGRSVVFDIEAPDGSELPAWTPGSHIELKLTVGGTELIRQYSLCGEALTGTQWRIAVLREESSRG